MRLLRWMVFAFVGVWFTFLVITVRFFIHPAVLQRVNLLEYRDDPDSIDSRVPSYYASTLTTPTSEYATTVDTQATADPKIHPRSLDITEAVNIVITSSKALEINWIERHLDIKWVWHVQSCDTTIRLSETLSLVILFPLMHGEPAWTLTLSSEMSECVWGFGGGGNHSPAVGCQLMIPYYNPCTAGYYQNYRYTPTFMPFHCSLSCS